MIVVGQLLAVFMANAGGAWDNAKKTIEDEPKTETHRQGQREAQGGRHRRHRRRSAEGHRRPGHQPADQGDEHGQPVDHRPDPAVRQRSDRQDARRLAENPLSNGATIHNQLFYGAIAVSALGLIWAIWQSKRETGDIQSS